MLEVISLLAVLTLITMLWLLLKAKQYNKFLRMLIDDIKPQLVEAIKIDLIAKQSELTPNNQAHIDATIYYWTCHKVRIFQGAYQFGILDDDWLSTPQNKRNVQHLMHVEQAFRV